MSTNAHCEHCGRYGIIRPYRTQYHGEMWACDDCARRVAADETITPFF